MLQIFYLFLIFYNQYFFCKSTPIIGVGVRLAEENEFPFVVSLRYNNKTVSNRTGQREECHECGGSLITRKHVLTAAHCIDEVDHYSDITVKIGSVLVERAKTYEIESWITCDNWAKSDFNPDFYYDIAIITLNEIVSSDIELPQLRMDTGDHSYGKRAMTAGWGVIENGSKPRHMRTAELEILKPEKCPFSAMDLDPGNLLPKMYMCTKAEPPVRLGCGDSGSPLLINKRIIIGVNTNCWPDAVVAASEYRNMHARVHFYKKFIEDVVNVPLL